jgi:hypothetical protein
MRTAAAPGLMGGPLCAGRTSSLDGFSSLQDPLLLPQIQVLAASFGEHQDPSAPIRRFPIGRVREEVFAQVNPDAGDISSGLIDSEN